jgi:uncharacterized protein DUF1629
MTTHPSEQARKRYYLVSLDMTRNSGDNLSFANREEALVNGRLAGTHEREVPGVSHPLLVGIPPLRKKPELVVGGSGRRALDYYGPSPIFVSNRAKELLEGIDPQAFEFAECETVTRRGDPIEPYWWMAVIRLVQFDEERSDFQWYRDAFPTAPDAQRNPTMVALNDIHMPKGFPDEYHAFWIGNYRRQFVFDEVLADPWRGAGLLGAQFTPLQPPTKAEFKHHNSFINYPIGQKRPKRNAKP